MKNRIAIILVLLVINLTSCKVETSDPKLVGSWTDTNLKYTFNTDNTYGIKYLRSGTPFDTITADTTWGKYVVDSKRSNVSFEIIGLRTRKGEVLEKPLLNATWNYKIVDDTVLTYKSATTLGTMKKR
jgi:hypothetical protein